MSKPILVSRSSQSLSPLSPLHRSRDPPLDPPPSHIGYFCVADLSIRSILTSSLWLLAGRSDGRTDDRCSRHTQPLLVLFPADTHAGSRKAYENGEDRVQCPRTVFVSSGEDCQGNETRGRDEFVEGNKRGRSVKGVVIWKYVAGV